MGYTDIVQGCDGADALEKFKSIEFIFNDWNMPNINEYNFVKEVHA